MVNVKDVKLGKNTRKSFAKINEVLEMPNLIEVQKNSYQWFLDEGLKEVFRDVSAITDYNGTPNGLRQISSGVPSSRNGISSCGSILETTPLLP